MPTYRYTALLCRDPENGYTAFTLDGGPAAFAESANEAKKQLADFLLWQHRHRPYTNFPDFLDAELTWQPLTFRPEYKSKERIYPCDSSVEMRVACVTGRRASGQPTADLPLLGVRFDYHNAAELTDLVRRYSLQALEGFTPEKFSRYLPPHSAELIDIPVRVPKSNANRTTPNDAPPTLKQVAEPVGDRAIRKGFARAWERDAEVAAVVHKLHAEKANILFVGEPGVGKTTLMIDAVRAAETLSQTDDESKLPRPKRKYWLTSSGRLVAGMKYLGQWEERVEKLIDELGEIQGVMCVDQLLGLVQRGGGGPTDSIAAFLQPYLSRAEVRMIAEATPAELDACRRLLPGLADLFQIVRVEPFDRTRALMVIDKQLETAASGHRVEIGRGSGERIVRLYRRFLPYAPFPGPASAFARELVHASMRDGSKTVDPDFVVSRFRARTGLPERFLRDELTLDRSDVLNWFRERVIDQPEACQAAADIVMTVKAGLNDPARPMGVLLFCGPTGVGKTHMALALAEYFFGHCDTPKKPGESPRLIRFDMSEFGGFDAVPRLLGSPSGEPGELVRRVRQQPFCVLLLDEIEKASADVFDTLMGVFDEGRLTDQYGRVTNFRSAIILMTSNIGAGSGTSIGFGRDKQAPVYRDAAFKFFRPEFFNRIDAVVTFQPLAATAIRAIACRELAAIEQREGIAAIGLRLQWGNRLIDHLAEIGFDARYGARPLQRTIERTVVASLAKWLLNNPGTLQSLFGEWNGSELIWEGR